MNDTQRKQLKVVAGVTGVILVTLIGFNIWRNLTYAKLVVEAAPKDLTMTIDGKAIESPRTVYVRPGSYKLVFTMEGFSTYKKKYVAVRSKTTNLPVALFANTTTGRLYLQQHPKAQADLERVGGKMEAISTAELTQKYPLIKKLPVTIPVGGLGEFKIEYRSNDVEGEVKADIIITYSDSETKQMALEWIRDQGFDPSKYNIVYRDLLAPVGSGD